MIKIKNLADIKVGVLGGGQLGKMMGLAAANWHLSMYFLDRSENFPGGILRRAITEGDFRNFSDVYNFGRSMDLVTIEIEDVNTDALRQLRSEGITVHPNPEKLDIIKDKGLQKQFYKANLLPTAPFRLYPGLEDIRSALSEGRLKYPFVQKARTSGYDGKGVAVVRDAADLPKLLSGPSLIEEQVTIQKELAVVVARNADGDIKTFPTVEMEFHPTANLVEYLVCPASISAAIEKRAQELAVAVMEAFGIAGLLAVELFLDQNGRLLINEVAPRPHNSGHHTIDSCPTSQFEQHLRSILNLPLGDTTLNCPAVMINLLGHQRGIGPVEYAGFSKALAVPGANFHLYGKSTTRPFRKMGHVTILDHDLQRARTKAEQIRASLQIRPQHN